MRSRIAVLLLALGLGLAGLAPALAAQNPDWTFNATLIEACSCPMFCQCYFNTEPAHHHGEGKHFCLFNNAFRVNRGAYGDLSLDGALFWLSGDLGADYSQGKMDWAVLTFDPSVTPDQRQAIQAILPHIYPAQWASFKVAPDAKMAWNHDGHRAVATLDGGRTAEVVLQGTPGPGGRLPVIHDLAYWAAPRNDGFVLMKNEVEAYRAGERPYEYKGTNGFMITIDMNSKDLEK